MQKTITGALVYIEELGIDDRTKQILRELAVLSQVGKKGIGFLTRLPHIPTAISKHIGPIRYCLERINHDFRLVIELCTDDHGTCFNCIIWAESDNIERIRRYLYKVYKTDGIINPVYYLDGDQTLGAY